MNDRPNALELLHIAHQTLAQEILPSAQPEQRYTLRMIANALGIAARELESHDKNTGEEMHSLNLLYNEAHNAAALHTRNRQLALDIRHGKFEGSTDQEARLRLHLLASARVKLAAAYPKGLQKTG